MQWYTYNTKYIFLQFSYQVLWCCDPSALPPPPSVRLLFELREGALFIHLHNVRSEAECFALLTRLVEGLEIVIQRAKQHH